MTPEIRSLGPIKRVTGGEPIVVREITGEQFSLAASFRLPDNAAPPADAFAHVRLASTLRADVAGRQFATFADALGGEPASRDVSRTVDRLRARAPYELTAGPLPASLPIAGMWPDAETNRRIERGALGIAALLIGVIVLRVGVGL